MKLINTFQYICLLLLTFSVYAHDETLPSGLWRTYNDQGQLTGYVRIIESNGIYTGVIEKVLEEDKDEYCMACKDERKGHRLIGMIILKNVKAKGGMYEGDEILDPFTGNTYRVNLKLKEASKKLEVRGFIGISLFGRTQIWEREENGQ